MELFKTCSKRVFINQYCTTKIFFYQNVCSKQVGDYFLVYSSLISIVRLMLEYKKCVLKASGNLLFSLLSYFVHESIRNFCFLIIIRHYFVWKIYFFLTSATLSFISRLFLESSLIKENRRRLSLVMRIFLFYA